MYKIIKITLLVFLLILVRYYEAYLFYDPFLFFFKNDYLYMAKPDYELVKLIGFITLRYALNTIISLTILFVIFNSKDLVKFSVFIFSIAFVILILLFSYLVMHLKQTDYYLFFVIRRVLIQPILLIFLLPAFYYQKLQN